MKAANPYLNFNGNTEEAFSFYRSVFGGEFPMIMRFKDTPEAAKVPADVQDKLMYIALPLGKNNMLMATDACESMGFSLTSGNNMSICISAESETEAGKLFDGLSAGGKILVPLAKQSWGDLFGQVTDKFGIQWMIDYSENHQ